MKRYIYKYTDNQIHIKYIYKLLKGGICVEVKSEEQKQLLISKFNITVPGFIAKTLSTSFEFLLIVKNFNSLISTENIKEGFKRTYQKICCVCRFYSNSDKMALPIINIKTNKTLSQTLLKESVLTYDKRHFCESCKQPVVCCFNCQRFGRRINNCLLRGTWENCGKPLNNHPCRDTSNCFSCQGNHKVLFKHLSNLYYFF